jgi:hypothetical protein
MMNIFDQLNDEVLQKLRKCKDKKTCEGLSCRGFYFEPNRKTIQKWQEEGLYKKGIDRRVIFVCESPGPGSYIDPEDIDVKRCWSEENANPRSKGRLKRFRKLRESYGFENCYITNVVKCGPRNGSYHSQEEIKECSKFLAKELEIIQPRIIIAVGRNAENILRKCHMELIKSQGCELIEVMHYSRGNPQRDWDKQNKKIKRFT